MGFPRVDLPVPLPSAPMEAKRAETIPDGGNWIYEPKWDGFRALVFRDGDTIVIQSKNQKPLGRYFPDLEEAFRGLKTSSFVLDGEVIIPVDGRLSFDDLLLRIHPAESRVLALAEQTPAMFVAFDLLASGRGARNDLTKKPFRDRRRRLESFLDSVGSGSLLLTPSTTERETASRWFDELSEEGLDGVMAKRSDLEYRFGERDGMLKVKHLRTVDCVVGGYRLQGKRAGSLVLGLYDGEGRLHHVGHTASLPRENAQAVSSLLATIHGDNPFDVGSPGGPSRWSRGETSKWQPLEPRLVAEVRYDHFSQGRFRHGSRFMRWRPDKDPEQCRLDQVESSGRISKLLSAMGAQ